MKLAEFNALCGREWAKRHRGGRGDVVSLRLTPDSHRELTIDVLLSVDVCRFLSPLQEEDLPAIRCGAMISEIVNPITRTVVKIRTRPDGKRETARVAVMSGTYRQTWWRARASHDG